MNKKRILENAAFLFARYGIKSVSMDSMASHLRMSKKTIYEFFTDKEDLVNQCLHNELELILSFSKEMEKYSESLLEKVIIQSVVSYGYVSGYCPAFYRDLEKYRSACEGLERYASALIDEHKEILQEGIRQGYFGPDQNPDIIMRMFRDQLNQIKKSFGDERITATEFLYLLTTMLRGICTEKSLPELERIRLKWTEPGKIEQLIIRGNI